MCIQLPFYGFGCRFDVLDSLSAPANPFLLRRNTSGIGSLDGLPMPLPGKANRWRTGEQDSQGLTNVVMLQSTLAHMADVMVRTECSSGKRAHDLLVPLQPKLS
jgi:hypothetical protein